MNVYESLEDEACKDGVDIIKCNFKSPKIKGLYCDRSIGISGNLISSKEKSCIVVEELGHHFTSVGNILDMSDTQNRKQERQARLWGYNKLIGLRGLVSAFEHGCQGKHDIAEYLEVTEEFLQECIDCYREKYGVAVTVDNYCIMFIPYLAVGKLL